MKYVKMIVVIFVLFQLCGCAKNTEDFETTFSAVVEYPDAITKETVNGYSTTQHTTQSSTSSQSVPVNSDVFYCNETSKKFHLSTCRYSQKIDESHIRLETDRDVLISEGYAPCKVCNP